jgi:hypothetical protein
MSVRQSGDDREMLRNSQSELDRLGVRNYCMGTGSPNIGARSISRVRDMGMVRSIMITGSWCTRGILKKMGSMGRTVRSMTPGENWFILVDTNVGSCMVEGRFTMAMGRSDFKVPIRMG